MKHAIVIGGSMSGLLAARVLTDYFERVTIVERDHFPANGEQRRGVPQGRHTHGLLASGRRILDELFPGISETLIAAGALDGDVVKDSRWFFEGGCLSKEPSDLRGLLVSRPVLEGTVRERVLALPNILTMQDRTVEGLVENGGRVSGLKIAGAESPTADLVVDATGRGSHSPQWLEAIGFPKPHEERVEIAVAYATRLFRRCATDLNGDSVIVIPPTPAGKRGGAMLGQEGGRWTVTLVSHFGNAPVAELGAFIDFSKTLPAPYIHEVIRAAEPLCDGAVTRFPASVRHRYEQLEKFPEGYLVIGDAISSFNPIYGQGMSSSALQAMELGKTLAAGSHNLARRFFKGAAKVVDMPWSIAVSNDLRMPETTGPRNAGVNFVNWYVSRLHRAAHHDQIAALAFLRVANLLAPPPSVMHPKIVLRVAKGNIFRPRSSAPLTKAASVSNS
jgi:2-polyprenyl-6-methoxyphenol hydroxylase-like FAD-dependent oxidoreductase